jgi:ribosome-associated translation inhibitor RaiA
MNPDAHVHVPVGYILRQSTTVAPELLREYADRRLYFALRRFEDRVRAVTLRLHDENGPRDGVDSRCVITVDLLRGGPIVVEATSAWPTAAITAAAKRLNEVLRRHFARDGSHRGASRRAPGAQRGKPTSPPAA